MVGPHTETAQLEACIAFHLILMLSTTDRWMTISVQLVQLYALPQPPGPLEPTVEEHLPMRRVNMLTRDSVASAHLWRPLPHSGGKSGPLAPTWRRLRAPPVPPSTLQSIRRAKAAPHRNDPRHFLHA